MTRECAKIGVPTTALRDCFLTRKNSYFAQFVPVVFFPLAVVGIWKHSGHNLLKGIVQMPTTLEKIVLRTKEDVMALPWVHLQKKPTVSQGASGVYMMVNKFTNEVYVGQSVNIGSRIQTHHHHELRRTKEYDIYVLFIEDKELMIYYEERAIYLLEPSINQRRGFMREMSQEEIKAAYDHAFGSR